MEILSKFWLQNSVDMAQKCIRNILLVKLTHNRAKEQDNLLKKKTTRAKPKIIQCLTKHNLKIKIQLIMLQFLDDKRFVMAIA